MIVLCEMLDDWLVRCTSAKEPGRGSVDGTLLRIPGVGLGSSASVKQVTPGLVKLMRRTPTAYQSLLNLEGMIF